MLIPSSFTLLVALANTAITSAFQENCNNNLVAYWGQNSNGVGTPDTSQWEKPIRSYCEDDTYDVLNIAFLHIFNAGTSNLPEINLSFHCTNTFFPGTRLLSCPSIGEDIKYCQSRGKKVLMSLGGAVGAYGFSSDTDALAFSREIWDLFLGGSSTTRPFGSAVLDGVDLNIEGGSATGYPAFINGLRGFYSQDTSKKYYITGAPQCPFPDAFLGTALDSAWFDMVFVQFYNNYCAVNNPTQFNFNTWHEWAVSRSINKNVKVYLGVPGSVSSAGTGYTPALQVNQVVQSIRNQYPSFGGVMVWDASTSDANINNGLSFAQQIKQGLNFGVTCTTSSMLPILARNLTNNLDTAEALVPTSSTSVDVESTSIYTTQSVTSTNTYNCPIQGEDCTENLISCDGYNYARCDRGKWILTPCSNDQSRYCVEGPTGAYCDWAVGQIVRNCTSPSILSEIQDSGAAMKSLLIDFVLGNALNSTESAMLARIRTTSKPFSDLWKISFNLPAGQVLASVSRGTLKQQGRKVTIFSKASAEPQYNMAILIQTRCEHARGSSAHVEVPKLSTAQFWDLKSL